MHAFDRPKWSRAPRSDPIAPRFASVHVVLTLASGFSIRRAGDEFADGSVIRRTREVLKNTWWQKNDFDRFPVVLDQVSDLCSCPHYRHPSVGRSSPKRRTVTSSQRGPRGVRRLERSRFDRFARRPSRNSARLLEKGGVIADLASVGGLGLSRPDRERLPS